MQNLKLWLVTRFPALASRDYVLFLSGQFISVIGTWMQATALPYLAYRISGRPLDLGLIGFSTTLPTLLFALPAGVLVEHWDKRKAVIILQALMSVQAFGLAYLAFTNQLQIWHIVSLAFFYGSAVAVEVTARQAMLIELSGREALPSAIALQTTAFNLGRILGPLCAGWLIAATGNEGIVFLMNGISFVFVIIGLLFARTSYKVEKESETSQGMGNEFKEGLRYIGSNAVVLSAILMSTLLGFFGIPLVQQIPAIARDILLPILQVESLIAARTSSLYTAQGVGAVTAAFMMAYFGLANKSKTLLWGQVLFIIPIIILGTTTNSTLALILLAFVGWGTVTQLISMNTMIQVRVPNELRGRVFSIYFWGLQGVAPFGSILVGWVAQTWNVQMAVVGGGLACLAGVILVRSFFMQKLQSAG
ncbi:MAG TPA: MFS transporter [Anaerolineales bacterium]|nr:MFS transporter [Anaerolineales bacterium]HNB35608.1 MFS transporter [Anaerolineales bacterium]HNC07387.1 MFS transporter [Anaerolineales bacterium]